MLPALVYLIEKCHTRGIKIMATYVPATGNQAQRLVELGVDLLIVGVDLALINQGARQVSETLLRECW